MEQQRRDTITEETEELMVVPFSSNPNPTLRLAHFLKPSLHYANGLSFGLPFRSKYGDLANLGHHVAFNGWKKPLKDWNRWVDEMNPLHQSTWRSAGIYDAIIASTCSIGVEMDIVFGLGERWCSVTNSFVFPWGEATISLEDVMVLGGFSVLGQSVSSPIEAEDEEVFIRIEKKLSDFRTEMNKSAFKKASQSLWMKYLRGFGGETEHVAFLVLWLSRHVLPFARDMVGKHFHKMAFKLARGIRLALGPAVLACLYRDLRLLKENIISASEKRVSKMLSLWSLVHLVQVWAWERFPTFRPQPNHIGIRIARWNKAKGRNRVNARLAMDASADDFVWRPYAVSEEYKFYPEKENRVPICPGMHKDYESFAKFITVAELVGLNCVEPYFPHRVSMQFGMDQDIPGEVARCNQSTPDIAWANYTKLIGDEYLFIPSRHFKSAVTNRYLEWWTDSPRSKKNKAVFEDTATPMTKKVNVGKTESKIKGAFKGSEYKRKISNEKKGLVLDGRNKLPDDDNSSKIQQYTPGFEPIEVTEKSSKIPQYPPGFEPIEVIEKSSKIPQYPLGFEQVEVTENMLTMPAEVVGKHPVEGRAGIEVTDMELKRRISRLEMLVPQLNEEWLGHGSS